MFEIKKILVPTDFSDPSNLAVRYGHAMAKKLGAQLTVLHAVDDPVMFAETTSDRYREEKIEKSDAKLRENVHLLLGETDSMELVSICGSAANEIVDFARDQDVSMVVMGSHGRSAMASMLLGNTAEHVVRHSPCPVMAVRSPEHDF